MTYMMIYVYSNIYNNEYMYNIYIYIYIYIYTCEGKTLLYTTSSFMHLQSSGILHMF